MKRMMMTALLASMTVGPVACGDDDDDASVDADTDADTDTDTDADTDTDTDSDTDTDTDSDSDTDADTDDGIGSACYCDDASGPCNQSGVPIPTGGSGTIVGCEGVPTNTGSALVCLQSYKGMMATHTWFANGYCGLMATDCDGDDMICDSATFGTFADMTECPAGYVMIESTQEVDALSIYHATIQNKTCVKACSADTECRNTETDPVWDNEATQYQCIDDHDPVKFCYDPRNLPADPGDYTATQF